MILSKKKRQVCNLIMQEIFKRPLMINVVRGNVITDGNIVSSLEKFILKFYRFRKSTYFFRHEYIKVCSLTLLCKY